MKHKAINLRRLISTIVFLVLFGFSPAKHAYGQLEDLGQLFEGGKNDAQLLIREYVEPFGSGFGAGINSGWIDRANTHRVLGFHLKVNVSVAMVPEADRSFNVNEIGLTDIQLLDGDPNTPTFSGSSDPGPLLGIDHQINARTLRIADFRMPQGTGVNFIPTPMIQGGIGLPMDTDVMLRFIPPVNISDYGELYLYGLGVKHELNQWMPGGYLWPVTVSVMAGYTSFGSRAGLDARPENEPGPDNPNEVNAHTWDDQEISLTTDGFTMNLLVGHSLPVFSVYGGLGFETSTTSIKVDGNYPYYSATVENGQYKRKLNVLTDPVDLSFDGANSLRALVGLRVSLPLITFNVDYTLAEYSMITAGFGISFR